MTTSRTTAALAALVTMLALAAPAAAQERAVVSGTVYADADGDGQRDPGERPLEGVRVSDGAVGTTTGRDGGYSLTIDPARRVTDLVSVTPPSGYQAPPDRWMTPRFWADLGQLTAGEERTAEFALRPLARGAAPRPHEFLLMSDMQVGAHALTEDAPRFASQVGQLNDVPDAEFLIISGDLVHNATQAEFDAYGEGAARSVRPIYPAAGNHELTRAGSFAERIDAYRRNLGPEWYSFDHGGRHYVMLESYLGFAQADQLSWLREDLEAARGKKIVASVHYPADTPESRAEGAPFFELLERHGTQLVLAGHTHVNDVSHDAIDGATQVVTNSTGHNTNDQTPPGFRRVSLGRERVTIPFRPFDYDKRVTALHPAPGAEIGPGHTEIAVNAFDSAREARAVSFRVDDGAWRPLRRRGWATWTAPWQPSGAGHGKHRLELRVTDETDAVWQQSSSFTVGEPVPAPRPGVPWAMFKVDARHAGVAADAPGDDLRLAWAQPTGGRIVTSSPALVDGSVYIGVRDDDGERHNGLLALAHSDGRRRWWFPTSSMVQSSPAVADGIVYAASIKGTLHAVDAGTGRERWRHVTAVEEDGVQRGQMYHAPTVAGGAVYQGYATRESSYLVKLDGLSGRELWTARLERDAYHAVSPAVDRGRVYVVAGSGYLTALDDATAATVWRKRPQTRSWMHSTVALADGRLHVGFRTGLLTTVSAASGDQLWSTKSPGPSRIITEITPASPAVADGTVYMGYPDGSVAAHDAATGAERWRQVTPAGGIFASPTVAGELIYTGSTNGRLMALDRATGAERWAFETGVWQASTPAVSGNSVVVGAYDGVVYCFVGGRGQQRDAGRAVRRGGGRGAARVRPDAGAAHLPRQRGRRSSDVPVRVERRRTARSRSAYDPQDRLAAIRALAETAAKAAEGEPNPGGDTRRQRDERGEPQALRARRGRPLEPHRTP